MFPQFASETLAGICGILQYCSIATLARHLHWSCYNTALKSVILLEMKNRCHKSTHLKCKTQCSVDVSVVNIFFVYTDCVRGLGGADKLTGWRWERPAALRWVEMLKTAERKLEWLWRTNASRAALHLISCLPLSRPPALIEMQRATFNQNNLPPG